MAPRKKKAATSPPRRAAKKSTRRSDFGASVESFFVKQPPQHRAILELLHKQIMSVASKAQGSLKWGMPLYTLDEKMFCALGASKAHVTLIMVGPPDSFSDPQHLLSGTGKMNRNLRLTSVDDIPRKAIRDWLLVSATYMKSKAKEK